MPSGVYPRTPEVRAKNRAGAKKYHQEHPGVVKKAHNTPSARANKSAGQKKYYQEHPGTAKERNSRPETRAKNSAAVLKAKNSPEVYVLIQQCGSPLIDKLRSKYYDLVIRCNDSDHLQYKDYGGRGIQNLFSSPDAFVIYIINELHITQLSQIKGLQIDRIDNNSHYMPGNIRFVTAKVNANNRRNRKPS